MLFRNDAVNTAQSYGFIQLSLGRLTTKIGCKESLVLNHSTVKIDHIQATIRTYRCINRTKSFISTSKKFPLFPNRIGIELMNIFIRCREWFFRKKRLPQYLSRETLRKWLLPNPYRMHHDYALPNRL